MNLSVMAQEALNVSPLKTMTVADLIDQLQQIQDTSTPVYLESGEPVHYTCHGMNQTESRFFIGVM